ncbi:MAG TPA: LptF/LptG family permease [Tepidisphaeraceae bacterium]|jgi:lipopolysaccharide export LptBFGC system permease protein LptF
MSRTLFFYIFKDLFRIFMMTSGALAGIMSFGGLLRPLTEHGLDASQAAKMLSYFMPAMTTYSLPIAALFATTMVYGRLSADNEIVACRAAGFSYRSVAMPAVVLGLLVALVSLIFLCFIVPVFTLKVEKVIYSNLAQLIANQIERTHQIKLPPGDRTLFAQEAAVGAPDPEHPKEQRVTLGGLMIVSLEKDESGAKGDQKLQVAKEFYLARQATIFIRPSRNGEEFTLDAKLEGGSMFPRRFSEKETTQGGLAATEYGPWPISSVIKEDTKFMDIRRLHQLDQDLSQSRRVQEQLKKIIRQQQEAALLAGIHRVIVAGGSKSLDAATERYELSADKGKITLQSGKLVARPGKLIEYRDGKLYRSADAQELELTCQALADDQINVQVELRDVVATTAEGRSDRRSFLRTFVVPATLASKQLEAKGLHYFQSSGEVSRDDQLALRRERLKIGNAIQSEMHARASFGVSCLILVVVGCWLGMMFRSGNFLSAFALSVMPALLCIALIVAGQHTATNIPYKIGQDFKNPLSLGIMLIWSGNVAALTLAVVLGVRLNRQ